MNRGTRICSPLRHHSATWPLKSGETATVLEGTCPSAEFPRAAGIYHIDKHEHKRWYRNPVILDLTEGHLSAGGEGAHRSARQRLEEMARRAKRDGIALYLAVRDPRVAWPVKAFAVLVAAYVLSPIDLIPDFIPVLGLLDELILLPLAVGLIVRWIDPAVMADLRARASALAERPRSRLGAALILLIWASLAGLLVLAVWSRA